MNTELKPTATMYRNGVIRNADNMIVAFYDRERVQLHITGTSHILVALDEAEAMDMVGAWQARHLFPAPGWARK